MQKSMEILNYIDIYKCLKFGSAKKHTKLSMEYFVAIFLNDKKATGWDRPHLL